MVISYRDLPERGISMNQRCDRMDCSERIVKAASDYVNAIKTISSKPANLENLEHYLAQHFPVWLAKYANDPESLAAEMKDFADMDI